MLRIKRLYSFVIQTFFPVFMMTFAICLFVLLLQFLWKAVEDLVGKGLDNLVMLELFFYVALNLIPMALPLAILLAALMSFGNMGERLELLAIKAAGVSLLKAMRPLIIFIGFVCIGAFFFQNEAMPRIQVKFRSLYMSVKQKSPELDIPEGAFYSGIRNYNIYVDRKNLKTSMLYDVMIYDTSEGFDNMSVFVCDSAFMSVPDTKDHLRLKLFHGQRFANLKQNDLSIVKRSSSHSLFVPYSRENFRLKTIIIPFNSDFSRMDESNLDNTQIAKNINQLSYSIDSMTLRMDSINALDRESFYRQTAGTSDIKFDKKGIRINTEEDLKKQASVVPLDFDSLLMSFDENQMHSVLTSASTSVENMKSRYLFDGQQKTAMQKSLNQHKIEWHRKFVLSFACLIFFFIGAPLGAIIRKGGLGLPVVISILLFIVYYVIDNVGYKMARDGVWAAWQGMWLSSFILFPLGVFLTHKAMNDSALFNTEAYAKNFRKLLGIKTRIAATSSVAIVDITAAKSLSELNAEPELIASLNEREDNTLKDIIRNYKSYGYEESVREVALSVLKEKGGKSMDIAVQHWDYNEAGKCYGSFVKNSLITIGQYIVLILVLALKIYLKIKFFKWLLILAVVAYIACFVRSIVFRSDFYQNIEKRYGKANRRPWWAYLLLFVFYPFFYKRFERDMKNDLEA